jgi:hypothetical protein
MCPPLFHLKNQAGLDASYVDHNASGRDSTHPSRDISLLCLCTTEVLVSLWSALGFEELLPKAQQVIKTLEWKAS